MMSREEFDAHLVAIVSGNWESVTRLLHYFELDERLFQTPSPQKVAQISQCYSYMSIASLNNNPFATAFWGRMMEYGYGGAKDINQSLAKYRIAAEKFNNPWGQFYLGFHHIDQSEKSYFSSSKQSEKAKALELFLKAANQGHGQSAYSYAHYIDIQSEKDKWNRIARENGSHQALYDSICPKSWGNPLRLYMPRNKAMTCQWKEDKEFSSVSTHGLIDYKTLQYKVLITYENEVILYKNIDNTYPQAYAKSLNLAKWDMRKTIPMGIVATLACPVAVPYLLCANCSASPGCTCNWCRETYKDNKDRTRIASSIDEVTWEQSLSQLIREADGIISQRLEQRRPSTNPHPPTQPQYPQHQQPPLQLMPIATQPNTPPDIKLSDEQFKIWMAAQGLRHPASAPQQQSMEGQPLFYNPNPMPPQSPPPIYVSPQGYGQPQGYNPQFFVQPLPSAPLAQGLQMAVNNPGQSVRLPSGALFKFG